MKSPRHHYHYHQHQNQHQHSSNVEKGLVVISLVLIFVQLGAIYYLKSESANPVKKLDTNNEASTIGFKNVQQGQHGLTTAKHKPKAVKNFAVECAKPYFSSSEFSLRVSRATANLSRGID